MKKLTKKQIVSVNRETEFDPRVGNPMKIVTDVPEAVYYEYRAIEEIQEAAAVRITSGESEAYRRHIVKARQLLIMAQIRGTE